jgi:dTDP-glucose pyrophosphorylase
MLPAEKLQPSCLSHGKTLADAIRALNGPAEGMAIVLDERGKVSGVLTDGDVRRALMKESRLDALLDPYVRRNFLHVSENESREQILDLMQAKRIKHLPVLDGAGRLVGIHQLHAIVGGGELPNHAVIMAGGRGERLRPITEHLPKPMIKVAGRPILERLVLHLVGSGITRIHISVNYLADMIERHFGDGSRFGCCIDYLREDEHLGTGGALSLLPTPTTEPLLVLNGDLVTQVDFSSMLRFHSASQSVATIGYRPYSHQVPFGCVDLLGDAVVGIQEKPIVERCVSAGVYVLSSSVVGLVPKKYFPITELFQILLQRGEKMSAYEITADWADVGQHRDLSHARGEY